MRRLIALVVVILLGAGTYAGSALVTAWQIRDAIRTGDTRVLEARVDWASVRTTLKQTAVETRQIMSEMSESAGVARARPGLWQRIKTAVAPVFADPLIDRYVTAEGAPQIWKWRQTWRQRIRPSIGLSEPSTPLARTWLAGSALDQGLTVLRNVERAAFSSPMRMEFDIRDRYVEARLWRAVLEMRAWSWTLTEVHLMRPTLAPLPAERSADASEK